MESFNVYQDILTSDAGPDEIYNAYLEYTKLDANVRKDIYRYNEANKDKPQISI